MEIAKLRKEISDNLYVMVKQNELDNKYRNELL